MKKEEYEKLVKEEGNYMEFKVFGLPCVIKRVEHGGHWCGYVGIKKGSRLWGKNYYTDSSSELGISKLEESINNIEVHGGLTFAGQFKKEDDNWHFGFDCAHAGDLMKYSFDYPKLNSNEDIYRDKNYVIEECKNLAGQIKEIIELKL